MSPQAILPFLILAAQAAGAPITFNTALPVAKEDYVTRLMTSEATMENDMETSLDVSNISLVFAYGVHSKLAIYTAIPILEKRFDSPQRKAKASGPGDVKLFARQTIWQSDRHGATTRFAAFGGIEAPTGDDALADFNGLLPRPAQLGSGAFDPFLGFVLTQQTFSWGVDLSLSHQFQGRNGEFKTGDQTRLDLSLQRRLLPQTLDEKWRGFLYGVVEFNTVWNAKNEIGSNLIPESGGRATALSIGMQYVTNSWILETAYTAPIVEDLRASTFSPGKGVILSLRRNF